MTVYNVIDIEGIGPAYAKKLEDAGIKKSDQLLEAGKSKAGRKALAEKTGISDKLILNFINMVDLFRVPGIGPQFAELLEEAGVDTVPELAQRNAANLTIALAAANDKRKLTGRNASEAEVTKWVAAAKELPRVIEY